LSRKLSRSIPAARFSERSACTKAFGLHHARNEPIFGLGTIEEVARYVTALSIPSHAGAAGSIAAALN
jgi:hypothetical protein